nr:uncharacterized protein LOC107414162 isoform X1 [Ziziphus jujuba var. spinosa]
MDLQCLRRRSDFLAMELIHGYIRMEYENAAFFQGMNGGICILTKWNNETENVGDRDLSWQQEREGKWWWEVDKAMNKTAMDQNLVLLEKWTLLFLSTFPFHFSQARKQAHVQICPKRDLSGIEVKLESCKQVVSFQSHAKHEFKQHSASSPPYFLFFRRC